MTTYTLFQLNEFIRRILALNLAEALWITGEIGEAGTARGHWYLSLLQKDGEEGEIIARAEAVIWEKTYRQLRRRLGPDLEHLLQEGMSIRLKVRVDFHERYGLKLVIEDLDPAFTIGQLALQRRQTILALKRLGLMERNGLLPLPPVLQRIAVLSAETAAGYQDFRQQLAENPYGYGFRLRLFPTAMQGRHVETEMLDQLRRIASQHQQFDAVAIIRGGGARLDLSAFDSQALGEAIARFPLPVFTGIGHDIDETVADLVAHSALKTPTAVAAFILHHNLQFESILADYSRRLQGLARQSIHSQSLTLHQVDQQIRLPARQLIRQHLRLLDFISGEIPRLCRQHLRNTRRDLDQLEKMSRLLSVETALSRGFSITTTTEGKLVTSARELKKGDRITTRLRDGEVDSELI